MSLKRYENATADRVMQLATQHAAERLAHAVVAQAYRDIRDKDCVKRRHALLWLMSPDSDFWLEQAME